MFIAALFKITKRWKQHKCLSTEEWIKRMWNAMEYYPAIKRNQIVPFAEMWIDLRLCDKLSQRAKSSQKEKNKYHTLTHTCGI